MTVKHLDLPFLAETLVMRELSKLGIFSVRLSPQFDFDLYCANDARIEVKSSRINKQGLWLFHNYKAVYFRENGVRKVKRVERDRACDYFLFVGFDNEYEPNFFIIPKKIIGTKIRITIKPIEESQYWEYYGNWEIITEFTGRVIKDE